MVRSNVTPKLFHCLAHIRVGRRGNRFLHLSRKAVRNSMRSLAAKSRNVLNNASNPNPIPPASTPNFAPIHGVTARYPARRRYSVTASPPEANMHSMASGMIGIEVPTAANSLPPALNRWPAARLICWPDKFRPGAWL